MNFLNIFEDHVAGIFGATRAPFSFKKLAKQAARDMEDQTLVINGVNTAPALYTILIAADDDPMLAPFYPELSREVREFVKAQAEKRRYVFVGEPLVRFMIDPQLRAGKFSVFAENVDAPTLGRLYEEERAYQNGLGQNNSAASRAASAPRRAAALRLRPGRQRRDEDGGQQAEAGGQRAPFHKAAPRRNPTVLGGLLDVGAVDLTERLEQQLCVHSSPSFSSRYCRSLRRRRTSRTVTAFSDRPTARAISRQGSANQ